MSASRIYRFIAVALAAMIGNVASAGSHTQATQIPDPRSPEFCAMVQRVLANTDMTPNVTVFDNMPDYRSSKPSIEPLNAYQLVTYSGDMPIIVSCKVKTSDHLQTEFGEDAAGKQRFCPEFTQMLLDQAVAELQESNPDAAAVAAGFIVENTEPYATGSSYLGEYNPLYRDAEGKVHIVTPGLQTDWGNWMFWLLPNRLRGQTYCHLPTTQLLQAVATGEMDTDILIHTRDDAPTKPASAE